MQRSFRWHSAWIAGIGLLLTLEARAASSNAPRQTVAAIPEVAVSAAVAPAAVLSSMKKVADWQLSNPSKSGPLDWMQGACYAGMMALASISDDPKYHDAMMEMGRKNDWKPRDPAAGAAAGAKRAAELGREPKPINYLYHADEQCVMQTYFELYLKHRDPQMLAPSKERCDRILAAPPDDDLDYSKPHASEKWCWCDALFMAPPVWARLAAATGDRKYLDFMNHGWWLASNHLYDKEEHLYSRDDRFLARREAGKKIFWGRGNGWVMSGLARVLRYMPADYPDRPKYVAQLREMSSKLTKLQGEDGLWRASLLDPVTYPMPETSGSSLILHGLAYGVNQGLLDRAVYEPSVLKAWQGLVRCVDVNGKLGFVQPPGGGPAQFASTNTEVYGVGGFLLAGSEVYRLAKSP